MAIIKYKSISPRIEKNVFIAEGAQIIGNVHLKKGANIWYNAVLRGDIESIVIGENTNIQDNVTCHVDYPPDNLIVGDNVTVGHNAILHGCKIGDGSLIGMGAIILSGAKIGKHCVVAAGALVLERQVVPDDSLVVGMPGKIVRKITINEKKKLLKSAIHYQKLGTEENFRNLSEIKTDKSE
jgi:carbonic anhydrase/acetyltransferase-like protein (isoleucine patch superfamily)